MKKLVPLIMLLLLFGCTISTSVTTCVDDPLVEVTKGVEMEFYNADWRNRDLMVTVELLNESPMHEPILIGELKLRPGEKWMFCVVRKVGETYRIIWKTLQDDVITKQIFVVGPPTKKVSSEPFDLLLEFDQ